MNKKLVDIIKSLDGCLIAIGIENNNLLDAIVSNSNLLNVDLLHSVLLKQEQSEAKSKNINIDGLRKHYKKKKVTTIICNYEHIKENMHTFINDSSYVVLNTIYIYGNVDDDAQLLIDKYMRYGAKIDKKNYKEGKLITVDISNHKYHFIKDMFYRMIDFLDDIRSYLTNILTH